MPPINAVVFDDGDCASALVRVKHKGAKVDFAASLVLVLPPPFSAVPRQLGPFTEEMDLSKVGSATEVIGSLVISHAGAVGPFLAGAEQLVSGVVKAALKT